MHPPGRYHHGFSTALKGCSTERALVPRNAESWDLCDDFVPDEDEDDDKQQRIALIAMSSEETTTDRQATMLEPAEDVYSDKRAAAKYSYIPGDGDREYLHFTVESREECLREYLFQHVEDKHRRRELGNWTSENLPQPLRESFAQQRGKPVQKLRRRGAFRRRRAAGYVVRYSGGDEGGCERDSYVSRSLLSSLANHFTDFEFRPSLLVAPSGSLEGLVIFALHCPTVMCSPEQKH